MPTTEELAAYDAKLAAAMLADSPERPAVSRKRKHAGANPDNSEDEEDDDELPGPSLPPSSDAPTGDSSEPNSNMVAFARQYATHKRLKPSQVSEVEAFAADPLAARQVKLFTLVLGVNSKLDGIVSAQPAFKVSPALEKNLRQLAHGITISSRLSSYKGELAKKHLLNIVRKSRFDLPPGIENVPSDWGLVKSRAEYHLTQARATFKKFLKASILPKADPKSHTNIFALGQRFVKDTETVLTVELCARIALMRQQYKLFPGDDFWDKLDQRLAWIRKTAGYDENKISKAFKLALADDRAEHGRTADYTLPEDAVIDAWQASVDTSIDADGPDA
ncbi:hypothetical protein DFH08DRAFT_811116 [Mycena albidolilacea]|uniref:Uncharacterized protein n=1 Tax=Mycena albidolilacea TaxID=1033008 RepID=A0AAD6ZW97_9AGAR|nr:hypothetical protein DFH08DRAFT_811116 [Mycena albidolilacea]